MKNSPLRSWVAKPDDEQEVGAAYLAITSDTMGLWDVFHQSRPHGDLRLFWSEHPDAVGAYMDIRVKQGWFLEVDDAHSPVALAWRSSRPMGQSLGVSPGTVALRASETP